MQQYLEAGRIVTTHGVRGEVKLELWCDGVDFCAKAGRVYATQQGGRSWKIASIRPQGQMALLKLEGVEGIWMRHRPCGTGAVLLTVRMPPCRQGAGMWQT